MIFFHQSRLVRFALSTWLQLGSSVRGKTKRLNEN